jgi:hypothetical protein
LKFTSIDTLVIDPSTRQPSRGRIDTNEILEPRQVATTIPPWVLNDAVCRSTAGAVARGPFDVGRGSGVSEGR